MNIRQITPPRIFGVGQTHSIRLSHCADVELSPDEMLTFVTDTQSQYDVVRKSWGFYATASLNHRMKSHGLESALVRSKNTGHVFVLLIENGKNEAFKLYCDQEKLEVLLSLSQIEPTSPTCLCGIPAMNKLHAYTCAPKQERHFQFMDGKSYSRRLYQCSVCSHVQSIHSMDDQGLYSGDYAQGSYQNAEGIKRAFERIVALPPERSDNHFRVQRINNYFQKVFGRTHGSVLDIGSGLCVFLYQMKKLHWDCTGVDVDAAFIDHAKSVGLDVLQANLLEGVAPLPKAYDLVTFNKVLEHVKNPVELLRKAHDHVTPQGLVYVELPDAEQARKSGFEREEFFIEHHHVFSMASLSILADKAGFQIDHIERIHEPSTKFTLCAFLRKPSA